MNQVLIKYTLLTVLFALITGCTSLSEIPYTKSVKRYEPEQHTESTTDALVYIVRDGSYGHLIYTPVLVNNTEVASTYINSYLRMALPAGEYEITSQAENASSMRLSLESGKIYYLNQTLTPGQFSVKTKLQLATQSTNRTGLASLQQIKALPYK